MSKTYSCILVGLEVVVVEVECVIGAGFTGLHIIGLKSDIAKDMRERVRSALESMGIPIPAKRIIVNLSAYELFRISRTPLQELDFAVAASVIYELFKEKKSIIQNQNKEFFAGELTLSGKLKPVSNPLIYEKLVLEKNFDGIFSISDSELTQKSQFHVYSALSAWMHEKRAGFHNLKKDSIKPSVECGYERNIFSEKVKTLHQEIKGLMANPQICVAILIAAAGDHHLLVAGEPGIGKTHTIKKIIYFLKPLQFLQNIEIQLIYSKKMQNNHPPFRMPHHSSSVAALIGGQTLKPGEVTLAHHGVLFLDELAEFSRNALDALREPLDSGHVELSRSAGTLTYPAKFLLCATTNSCPCGYFFSQIRPCRCLPHIRKLYLSKISGPLLDRFDLKIWAENSKNSHQKNMDIFSNYLLDLSDDELLKFVEHFLNVQYQVDDTKSDFKIDDYNTSDMSQEMNQDFPKYLKDQTSLRGKYQLTRLIKTFKKVFPHISDEKNFTNDILKYRNFSTLLENAIVS